jgi:ankyrin repeat protein
MTEKMNAGEAESLAELPACTLGTSAMASAALLEAASTGELADLQSALDAGADIEARTPDGQSALLLASSRGGKREMCEYLLDRGADILAPSNDGETPLHGFAAEGWNDLALKAIDAGSDVNAAGFEHATPLAYATAKLQLGTVDLLLQHGANPFSARDEATVQMNIDTAALLDTALASGLSIDARASTGATMLMHAFGEDNDDADLCEAFIARGADIDAVDDRGQPALAYAAACGATRCFGLLLAAGANHDFRTHNGKTLDDLLAKADATVRAAFSAWRARSAMRLAGRCERTAHSSARNASLL